VSYQKFPRLTWAETDEKGKDKLLPCSSFSKASVAVTLDKVSVLSKISEIDLGIRSSPDEGLLDRFSRSKEPAKAESRTSETQWFNPSASTTDPPNHEVSISTSISSSNCVNSKEQNTRTAWSTKTFPTTLPSYETNFRSIKKLKKRKREYKLSPEPKARKFTKVAVSSNAPITTSEQQFNKPLFAPYQSTLQPRIIEALRTREYKSRSVKRRKRKAVNEVLYRISGTTKLKSEDTRVKLHQDLRTLATKQCIRKLPANDSKSLPSLAFLKPSVAIDSEDKLIRPCLRTTQETLKKKLQQQKHTGRLTCKVEGQSKNIVVVKRTNRKSKRKKRVRHAPREVTTIQKGLKRNKMVKARRSSRVETLLEATSREKGRLL